MSHSVFRDFDEDIEQIDGNVKSEVAEQNLVVFINKDGDVTVDPHALQDLIVNANEKKSTVSVIRVGSPTPSMESEQQSEKSYLSENSSEEQTDQDESNESETNSENEEKQNEKRRRKSKKNKIPGVSLTIENFYNPEQAKKFAQEIMHVAGITNPKQLKIDYDHLRYVIENDHCYTSLTYRDLANNKKDEKHSLQKDAKGNSKTQTSQQNNLYANKRGSIANNKNPETNQKNQKSNNDSTENDHSSEAEEAESELSDFSDSESDNDRDSDLDFSVNDLHSRRKLKRKKRRGRKGAGRKRNDTMEGHSDLDASTSSRRKYSTTKKQNENPTSPDAINAKVGGVSRMNSRHSRELPSHQDEAVTPKGKQPKPKATAIKATTEKKSSDALLTDVSSLFSSPDIIKKDGNGRGGDTTVATVRLLNGSQGDVRRRSIQTTHVKLATEQDKQLDLIDSLVQEELNSSPIETKRSQAPPLATTVAGGNGKTNSTTSTASAATALNNDIPKIVKMLETSTASIQPATQSATNIINDASFAISNDHLLAEELLDGFVNSDDCLTEDLLQHVAKLAEDKNIQEVIDQQVLGIDTPVIPTTATTTVVNPVRRVRILNAHFVEANTIKLKPSTGELNSSGTINVMRTEPIKVIRSGGRIITLPPIEAPTTRGAKRRAENPSDVQPQRKTIILNSLIDLNASTSASPSTSRESIVTPEFTKAAAAKERRASIQVSKRPSIDTPKRTLSVENSFVAPEFDDDDYDDASDGSYNSEDDPLRLWCICRRPHNNRFMICCDKCEDWFHGKCVGITKQMGTDMEQRGVEWVCPNCIKKQQPLIKNIFPKKVPIENSTEEKVDDKMDSTQVKCLVCEKTARANSIYCSDDCIRKHATAAKSGMNSENQDQSINASQSTAATSNAKPQPSPIASSSAARPIAAHTPPKILNASLAKPKQSHVVVRDKETNKFLMLNLAPSDPKLPKWLAKHPNYELVQSKNAQVNAAFKAKQKQLKIVAKGLEAERESSPLNRPPVKLQTTLSFDPDKKVVYVNAAGKSLAPVLKKQSSIESTSSTPKTPRPEISPLSKNPKLSATPQAKPMVPTPKRRADDTPKASTSIAVKSNSGHGIRDNVRKTLVEQLTMRTKEITDSSTAKLTDDEIKEFVKSTEEQMYVMFGDTNNKYRAKYRSLMFNIKDRKNKTLFEKISTKSVRPQQLVRMSPEEMASQELAKWRENENKHQLEMITKTELDLLKSAKNYLVKTHKGEEIIEAQSKIDVEDVLTSLNSTTESLSTAEHKSSRHASDRKSSSSSSGNKKKRERSKSRDRHESRSSSSKHKRHKSRDRHGHSSRDKSREHDKDRDRHRSSKSSKAHSSSDSKHEHKHEHSKHEHSKHEHKSSKHESEKEKKTETSETITSHLSNRDDLSEKIRLAETTIQRILHPEEFTDENVPIPSTTSAQVDVKPMSVSPIESPTTIDIIPSTTSKIWSGNISMIDVTTFQTTLSVINGDASDFSFPPELDVVGRINPKTVWDYLSRIKVAKELVFLRFDPQTSDDVVAYKTFMEYLDKRNRFGVFNPKCSYVKDFYIVPMATNKSLPSFIIPPNGLNLDANHENVMLGIIVKSGRRSNASTKLSHSSTPVEVTKLPTQTQTQTISKKSNTPPSSPKSILSKDFSMEIDDGDEPYSPEDSDEEMPYTAPNPPAANTSLSVDQDKIKREMEELNRQIEVEKAEIALLHTADIEPYSPSSSMTSSLLSTEPSNSAIPSNIANISIPPNLVDILKSISGPSSSSATTFINTAIDYQPSNFVSTIDSNEYDPTAPGSAYETKTEPSKLAQLTDEELLRLVPDDSLID